MKKNNLKTLPKRILNLFVPQVTRNMKHLHDNLVRDGVQNSWPDQLIDIVGNSDMGGSALDVITSFVKGGGINSDFSELMVNQYDTFRDLHNKVSQDYAMSGRYALRLVPNLKGELVEVHHVPFEAVRFGLPDQNNVITEVAVNYKFNTTDFRHTDTTYYPLFSPRTRFDNLRQDMEGLRNEYRGHILFHNDTTPHNRVYSRPSHAKLLPWMEIDHKLSQFHGKNIDNNFFLGGIISVVGNPDQGILDDNNEEYTTVGEMFEQELASSFAGSENTGRFMIDWIQEKGEGTEVNPWPSSTNHELFNFLEGIVEKRICMGMGVPKILLGSPTAGKLGDSQEIRNAVKLMNAKMLYKRDGLSGCYSMLAELFGASEGTVVDVLAVKDFTDLPESIMLRMSQSQIEQYLSENWGIESQTDLESAETQQEVEEIEGNTENSNEETNG